ncbi:60S ribosomal protein L31 [Candidatus Pacearchaeota archaeon]|nr:60S ribosomal protein L31 [Candidatus Pacearchaeota archaeon]
MAEEKSDIVLEREYIIPLRRKCAKVPGYKRANKAIKSIKEFLARHMRAEGRDLRKVKIDKFLNHEIWFKGIKNPPAKIKVKAKKLKNGEIYVELAEIPEKVRYDIEREKKNIEAETKAKGKVEEKKAEEKAEEKPEEKKEAEEKKDEVGGKKKDVIVHRMALKK